MDVACGSGCSVGGVLGSGFWAPATVHQIDCSYHRFGVQLVSFGISIQCKDFPFSFSWQEGRMVS